VATRRIVRTEPTDQPAYPFERDETHAGEMCRIPGRHGVFKVKAFETNPRTGATWWHLFGPVTAGDPGQSHHVRDITLIQRRKRST
jgi:hypothetical protein